jgi:DNA-binding response OmpR family regulator
MGKTPATAEASSTPAILVIDDDEVSRRLVLETLSTDGWRLIELSSPIGATRLLDEEGIDVVVLDVEMSGLRGDKLAKLFRENHRFAYVGVVLISARHEAELQALGASCGADSVVDKRTMRSNLLPAVRTALEASLKRRNYTLAKPQTGRASSSDGPRVGRKRPKPS